MANDPENLPWNQWHPVKNGTTEVKHVKPGSSLNAWWQCELGHEWQARVASRSRGARCPFCINQRVLAGFNDLSTTNPEQVKEWAYERNLPVTPEMVVAGSNRKFFWRCKVGHEFEMSVWDKVGRQRGCKYCQGRDILPGFNDFKTLYPELASQWDVAKNHPLTPEQVQPMSDKKAWFTCSSGHSWHTQVKNLTKGHGCPSCSGNVVVPGVNDLATVSPQISAEWSMRNSLSPSEVAAVSGTKAWWICSNGHEWEATVANRKQTGCPKCAKYGFSQIEDAIIYFIEHRTLNAWKIGITNSRGNSRLEKFERSGWRVIFQIHTEGQIAKTTEKAVFSWIRQEMGLPQFLDRESMGSKGGETETFSIVEEIRDEVIARIKRYVAENEGNIQNG